MQKRVLLVSVAAAVLGLVAAALGFVAERAKSKSFVGYDGRYCVYRRTAALGCGVAAAAFLLAGQAVLTAASGCFGRCGEAGARTYGFRKRSVVVKMSAIFWALTVAATGMFLYGAWRNAGARRAPTRWRYHSLYGCTVLKGGLFSTASASSVIALVVGITAYVYQETADPEPQQQQAAGPGPGVVGMAQPYFQPQAYPAMGYPVAAAPPPYGGYGGAGAKASSGTA